MFQIDLNDAKSLLRRYSSIYKNGEKVNGPGFAKILGIPFTQPVKELFELLKEGEEGEDEGIDFKQLF